jgi:hypothetical protein
VVLPTNVSELSNKMPMTAWTVAHKIGHAFQDHFENNTETLWKSKTGNIIERIGLILEKIYYIEESEGKGGYKQGGDRYNARLFNYMPGTEAYLTMKSAREYGNPDKKKLEDTFEIFPEIIAQWLISGKVTMTVKKAKSIALVEELNKLIGLMFRQVVGKVLVAT